MLTPFQSLSTIGVGDDANLTSPLIGGVADHNINFVNSISHPSHSPNETRIPRMPFLRTSRQFFRTLTALKSPQQILNPHPSIRTMATAMGKRLEGKTIVVTGASSGIGRSTALEFARTSPKNLRLILTARRIDTLKEIAGEIKKEVGEGVKVLPFKLDVSSPEEVRGFVGNLPEEWRDIDVLVNNA